MNQENWGFNTRERLSLLPSRDNRKLTFICFLPPQADCGILFSFFQNESGHLLPVLPYMFGPIHGLPINDIFLSFVKGTLGFLFVSFCLFLTKGLTLVKEETGCQIR